MHHLCSVWYTAADRFVNQLGVTHMLPPIGLSHFALPLNLRPDPLTNNVNRANTTAGVSERVARVRHDLPAAHVGIPGYNLDSLKPGGIINTKA